MHVSKWSSHKLLLPEATNLFRDFVTSHMIWQLPSFIKAFTTLGARQFVFPCMFRQVILQRLWGLEHLATSITNVPKAFVSPHVLLVIPVLHKSFSTQVTEVSVAPSMMLHVNSESAGWSECFITLLTRNSHLQRCRSGDTSCLWHSFYFSVFSFNRLQIKIKKRDTFIGHASSLSIRNGTAYWIRLTGLIVAMLLM